MSILIKLLQRDLRDSLSLLQDYLPRRYIDRYDTSNTVSAVYPVHNNKATGHVFLFKVDDV